MELGDSGIKGIIWALLGSLFGSTVFVVSRILLMNELVDPISMSALRFLVAGAIMLVWGFFAYGKEIIPKSEDLLPLFCLGLLGMAGTSTFLFYGQQITTATNGAIIREVVPVILNILISFGLGEALTRLHFFGLGASVLGTLLVTGALTANGFCFTSQHFKGDLLVFCSAICWVAYSFLGRKVVTKLGSFRTTTWSMLFGGLQLLVLVLLKPTTFVNWRLAWPYLTYLVLMATILVYLAWYKAMERLSWPLLNIIQCLTPVFTILIARVFLAEALTWLGVIGVLLVVFGIIIVGWVPRCAIGGSSQTLSESE